MDKTLFTTQYNTRPAGKKRKNIVNTNGSAIITFFCIGSSGEGFSICWPAMVIPIIMGNTKYGSGEDRSFIHKANGACRSSTLSSSTQYSAINTGIWTTMGKQPPSGL